MWFIIDCHLKSTPLETILTCKQNWLAAELPTSPRGRETTDLDGDYFLDSLQLHIPWQCNLTLTRTGPQPSKAEKSRQEVQTTRGATTQAAFSAHQPFSLVAGTTLEREVVLFQVHFFQLPKEIQIPSSALFSHPLLTAFERSDSTDALSCWRDQSTAQQEMSSLTLGQMQ